METIFRAETHTWTEYTLFAAIKKDLRATTRKVTMTLMFNSDAVFTLRSELGHQWIIGKPKDRSGKEAGHWRPIPYNWCVLALDNHP